MSEITVELIARHDERISACTGTHQHLFTWLKSKDCKARHGKKKKKKKKEKYNSMQYRCVKYVNEIISYIYEYPLKLKSCYLVNMQHVETNSHSYSNVKHGH